MNEGGICSALGMRGDREWEGAGGERERKRMGEAGRGADSACVWERGRREDMFKRFRFRERLLDLEDPGDLPSREGGEGIGNSLNEHWE